MTILRFLGIFDSVPREDFIKDMDKAKLTAARIPEGLALLPAAVRCHYN